MLPYNGKGKGKADTFANNDSPPPVDDDDPSMLSRIKASANSLTQNLFSGQNETNSTIAPFATSAKLQSSGSSSTGHLIWAESSKTSHPNALPDGQASIKVGHSEEHVRRSEEEFSSFLNGIDTFSLSEPSGTIGADSYKDIGATWGEAWARAQTVDTPEYVALGVVSRTVAEQEAQDGQDVLDLLSAPGWISQEFEAPTMEPPPEDYDWGLSPDQLAQIQKMTRHLIAPELHTTTRIGVSGDLVPHFDAEAKAKWISDWEGCLNRYAEEVWGGLLPLVKKAKQEVEEAQSNDTVFEKPKALRRLEAILGHLQQY